MKMSPLKKIIFFSLASLLALIILTANLKGLANDCFHAVDFTIYQQAIYQMADGDFNPATSVRSANTWNDHFDPALILFIPWVKIFNYSPYVLIIGEWLSLIGFILILWREKKWVVSDGLFIMGLVLFSRAFLIALESPIHPVTWSSIPLAWLIISVHHQRIKEALFAAFFLCWFRETYCLAIGSLAFYFLLKKEKKNFLAFLLLGLAWFILAFKVRPWLIGPLWPYGENIWQDFKSSPLNALIKLFTNFSYADTFKLFLPLIALLALEVKRFRSSPYLPILFFLAPLVAMHFVFNRFTFHYGVQFAAPLITGFVLSENFSWVKSQKKWLALILGLSFVTASSRYTKNLRLIFAGKGTKCTMEAEKTRGADFIVDYVHQKVLAKDSIISTGGIIPRLVDRTHRPFLIVIDASSFEKPQDAYDFLVLETGKGNIPWDLTDESVAAIRENCRTYSSEILWESNYHFFARGPFPRDCITKALEKEFKHRRGE